MYTFKVLSVNAQGNANIAIGIDRSIKELFGKQSCLLVGSIVGNFSGEKMELRYPDVMQANTFLSLKTDTVTYDASGLICYTTLNLDAVESLTAYGNKPFYGIDFLVEDQQKKLKIFDVSKIDDTDNLKLISFIIHKNPMGY